MTPGRRLVPRCRPRERVGRCVRPTRPAAEARGWSAALRRRTAHPPPDRAAVLRERSCLRASVSQTTLYRHAFRNIKWAALLLVARPRLPRLHAARPLRPGLRRLPDHAGGGVHHREERPRAMGRAGLEQMTRSFAGRAVPRHVRRRRRTDAQPLQARGLNRASSAGAASLRRPPLAPLGNRCFRGPAPHGRAGRRRCHASEPERSWTRSARQSVLPRAGAARQSRTAPLRFAGLLLAPLGSPPRPCLWH